MIVGTQPGDPAPAADASWHDLLSTVMRAGVPVAPRGQATVEILHHASVSTDLNRPVIVSPERKLNYHFMAAEALWIVDGRNDLATLVAHNKKMAEYSDDGTTLAGAYGPRLRPQLPYVVQSLARDRDTRQAALTIWTPNPRPSKDIPCTVAMVFSIRRGRLYQQVFMRSSDAWLGIPYDVFSFAAVAFYVACAYNRETKFREPVDLGHQTITMTSSHLYSQHYDAAELVTRRPVPGPCKPIPPELIRSGSWDTIYEIIAACRDERRKTGPFQ